MPDYEISLMVVVEADTIEEAVEEGRSDLAHWAERGQVNVMEMSTGQHWTADPDGVTELRPGQGDEVIRVLLTDDDDATLLVECPTSDEAEGLGYAAIMSSGGVSAWRVPETAVPVTAELLDQLREGSSLSELEPKED